MLTKYEPTADFIIKKKKKNSVLHKFEPATDMSKLATWGVKHEQSTVQALGRSLCPVHWTHYDCDTCSKILG